MHRPVSLSQPIYSDQHPDSLRAWLDVDLDALRRNAEQLRLRAGVPLIVMVKADAYGVGMLPVVRALGAPFREPRFGVDHAQETAVRELSAPWAVGVATLEEAAALRQAGCLARVFCSTPLTLRELRDARELDVLPALHRAEEIVAWSALRGGPWHLSIDTGMSRAGVRWDDVDALDLVLREHPPEGVFTHYHSSELADGSRDLQDARFDEALKQLGDALPRTTLTHRDNSAAIAHRPTSTAQLARPGIGLYGGAITPHLSLDQVVHLRARVVDVRDVNAGETASYNATWHATETRRVATLAAGYADGYRRHLSNRGEVLLRGQRVPIVGTVTMDMVMVDVTTLHRGCAIGDVATLIGSDGADCLYIDDVATRGGLSPYELLVGLRLRAPRRYFESSQAEQHS